MNRDLVRPSVEMPSAASSWQRMFAMAIVAKRRPVASKNPRKTCHKTRADGISHQGRRKFSPLPDYVWFREGAAMSPLVRRSIRVVTIVVIHLVLAEIGGPRAEDSPERLAQLRSTVQRHRVRRAKRQAAYWRNMKELA